MVSAPVQEIVHAFLQTYYQRMKTNPSKLSNLYSNTAELTHINYNQISPSSTTNNHTDIIPTLRVTGKDNINKFFTRHEGKINKLKVKLDTCDYQFMGISHKNILIVVTGELFWDGTPVHQFCQTFILVPVGKNSDIFDISNDIIRFIPDNFKSVQLLNGNENSTPKKEEAEIRHPKKEVKVVEEQPVSDSGTEDVVSNERVNTTKSEKSNKKPEHHHHHHHTKSGDSTKVSKKVESDQEVTSEVEPVKEEENNLKVEEPEKVEVKPEEEVIEKTSNEKEDSKALEDNIDTPVKPVKNETATEEEIPSEIANNTTITEEIDFDTIDTIEDTTEEESTSTSTPVISTPPAKLSWASKLASTDVSKEAKKILVAKPIAPTTVVTPEQHHANQHKNVKKNVNDKKTDMGSRKDNISNRRKKTQNGNGANKEGFYPVFINGSYGLNDEILKITLTKEFGPVMKVNSGENFAVIDFQTHTSQIAALDMKKMMIQGYEITIERKTNKKGSNLPINSSNKNTTTTTNDGFISSSKSHRKYQNNNPNKKRENSNL